MIAILLKHWATILFLAIIAGLSICVGILKIEIAHEKVTIRTIQTNLARRRAIAIEKARQIEATHAIETLDLSTSYANTITAIKKESDYENTHHVGIRCTFTRPVRLRFNHGKSIPNHIYLPSATHAAPTTQTTPAHALATQYLPTPEQLSNLPNQCAETTAGYLALQKFAVQECGAK